MLFLLFTLLVFMVISIIFFLLSALNIFLKLIIFVGGLWLLKQCYSSILTLFEKLNYLIYTGIAIVMLLLTSFSIVHTIQNKILALRKAQFNQNVKLYPSLDEEITLLQMKLYQIHWFQALFIIFLIVFSIQFIIIRRAKASY